MYPMASAQLLLSASHGQPFGERLTWGFFFVDAAEMKMALIAVLPRGRDRGQCSPFHVEGSVMGAEMSSSQMTRGSGRILSQHQMDK